MHPKDADGMVNSVDPDQTAPLGAVWSWSTLFAHTYLSENLGHYRKFSVHYKASIFLLIDLREIFLRFGVRGRGGGQKKFKIKSLKLISR